ncbi:MAG: hypothetical protein HOO96_23100, partial [Polyangiaceae bacterium]|nr:hypothetical protein [Polyangiaceae bacterium]
GGFRNPRPTEPVDVVVTAEPGPVRVLVRGTLQSLRLDGRPVEASAGLAFGVDPTSIDPDRGTDAGDGPAAGMVFDGSAEKTRFRVEIAGHVDAFWVVPRSAELPPPAPVPVDAGPP